MKYTSIDMSRETGMTTEGLRYYEKRGIFKTEKNQENGYRAYPIMKVPFVRMVRILNTYGISLDDIIALIRDDRAHLVSTLSAMEDAHAELTREIAWKQLLLKRLSEHMALVKRARQAPDDIWFDRLPDLGYLEYHDAMRMRRDSGLRAHVDAWLNHIPVVYPMPYLPLGALDSEGAYCPAGFSVPRDEMAFLGLAEDEYVRILPASMYLCRVDVEPDANRIDAASAVRPLVAFAKDKNLRPSGDVLFRSITARTEPNGQNLIYYLIMMPVDVT